MRRLIIRPGAIGDCILSLPAIECLRADSEAQRGKPQPGCGAKWDMSPDLFCSQPARRSAGQDRSHIPRRGAQAQPSGCVDHTEVWLSTPNVPLLRGFDAVRSIASTGLDLAGLPEREPPAALIERLREFDSIVSWYGSNRPEFRAAMTSLPFTFLDALPPEGARVHATDFYLAQASAVSPRECEAVPRIPCPRADGGFAVIHPFSGSPRKNWPLENFRRLAALLEPCKWCAGPEEPLDEAVRFDDLYELACWLATARVYIGNDSGITHLAAAVGTPVIALFGPTDPAIWGPRGPTVKVLRMDRVSPADVAREAFGML